MNKSKSNESPSPITILDLENGSSKIHLTKNIVVAEDDEAISYEYDENIIILRTRENLESYVKDNFELLFNMVQDNKVESESQKIARLENENHELKESLLDLAEILLGGGF